MRKILVAGNWKMNGSAASGEELMSGIVSGLDGSQACDILVCPTYVYLAQAAAKLAGSAVQLGAQNLSTEAKGAFTGEISGDMLTDVGCSHVLVGHSERRALYGEDDQVVAQKFVAAQAVGLVPVLCVGETLEERESNVTEEVVARQLDVVLDLAKVASFEKAIVAYEPVWAIGTGKTASPEQAQAVHAMIRERIAARDDKIADGLRILYGGSVNGGNAQELFSMPDVDGGLVGGASLKAEEFLKIIHAA